MKNGFSKNLLRDSCSEYVEPKVMFDTKKRIEVGENARKLVLSKHTWKKRIEKILKDIER